MNIEREEYGLKDRTNWLSGAWDDEPDRVVLTAHGLKCVAQRGWDGAWRGYVAVTSGHPWYGDENEWKATKITAEPHGSVTLASRHEMLSDVAGVDVDDCWWIGFDCSHLGDATPVKESYHGFYRSLHYVLIEIDGLAQAAMEASC